MSTETAVQQGPVVGIPAEDQVPLIWTTKGNVPISSLDYKYNWYEDENEISFVEQYFDGEELVKSSTHKLLKKPMVYAEGEAAAIA